MSIIEILEVIQYSLDPNQYLGGHLDIPEASSSFDSYSFDIAGWCVAREQQQVKIEILYEGILQAETEMNVLRPDVVAHFAPHPVSDQCGFNITINTLNISNKFELAVDLVYPENERVRWILIKGNQRPLAPHFEQTLQPIMVYGPGRSGSTWFMELLKAHPGIVVEPHHPYEVRSMAYWFHQARVLSNSADLQNSTSAEASYFLNTNWVGRNPYYRAPFTNQPSVNRWLSQDYINDLLVFSLQSIEAFNKNVAVDQNKPNALYFAEKCITRIDWVPQLAWELYSKPKEIFLIRDFRDQFCSIRSFNQKRGFKDFGYQFVETDWEYINLMQKQLTKLLANWQYLKSKAFLVHYEDLVLRPQETLQGVFNYLELEVTPDLIENILYNSSISTPQSQGHKTSGDLTSSVGRWKRELDKDLRIALNLQLGKFLTGFGYEV